MGNEYLSYFPLSTFSDGWAGVVNINVSKMYIDFHGVVRDILMGPVYSAINYIRYGGPARSLIRY